MAAYCNRCGFTYAGPCPKHGVQEQPKESILTEDKAPEQPAGQQVNPVNVVQFDNEDQAKEFIDKLKGSTGSTPAEQPEPKKPGLIKKITSKLKK